MGILVGFSDGVLTGFYLTMGTTGGFGGNEVCTRPLRVTRPISVMLTFAGRVGMGFFFPCSITVALY